MIPEYVILKRLLETPELEDLVGGRIMPPPRPQTGPDARLPSVVYQRVAPGRRYHEHGGPSAFGRITVQYSCFASTEFEAWAVALAIRKAIDGWSDRTASPSIQGVTVDEPMHLYENDTKVHHVMVQTTVRYADRKEVKT